MGVSMSVENLKVGRVGNTSFPPEVSCHPGAPCIDKCYAMASYRRWPNVRKAWDKNWLIWQHYPEGYKMEVFDWLDHYRGKHFRWMVGGDLPDQDYTDFIVAMAECFKKKNFLAFTKNHGFDFSKKPDNLSIVLSMWPNWGNPDVNLPRAWMQDGTEKRIPQNAIKCTGHCDQCFKCWKLENDVWFLKH